MNCMRFLTCQWINKQLFPLRMELAGSLESARIPRVKALRKNVISTSYFPHPLKDDKLLLDAKIKWLSLSSLGSARCRRSRTVLVEVLLRVFQDSTSILEVKNILLGSPVLSHPSGSSSNTMEREFCWFIGVKAGETRALTGKQTGAAGLGSAVGKPLWPPSTSFSHS